MELRTMARFPFSAEAQEYVRERGPSLESLISSRAYEGARTQGAQRVVEALRDREVQEHGFNTEAEAINELLSYPVARILVSILDDERLVRWYAHGEAVRAHKRLQSVPEPLLLRLASQLGLPAGRDGGGAGLSLHFADYLGPAGAIRSPEWKLVNREMDRGRVKLGAGELARLALEALRARIQDELPIPVPPGLREGFPAELERVKEALAERVASIEEESLGEVSIAKMPPCMRHLLAQTQGGVNIPHMGRFAIAAFLHHIGMGAEEILAVFSASPDFNPDLARYQVEHITGEGSGTEYTPPECDTMKTNGICHGADDLCAKDWMNHPLTYYRVRDKQARKRASSAGGGGDVGPEEKAKGAKKTAPGGERPKGPHEMQ